MKITWKHRFPTVNSCFRNSYVRLRWRKHEIDLFPERFRVFPQGCHAFTRAETPVSLDGNLTETYEKVVRFRRKRSDGNTGKRNVSDDGNMWLPSCFPPLNRPSKYKPPGACTWKIALKYKVKQSKNDEFTFNYKASPIDFETQISHRR